MGLLRIAKFILNLYLFLYLLIHSLVYFYPKSVSYLVFQNTIKWPFGDLSKPIEYGLKDVYNFYLTPETDVKIGIWHYLPAKFDFDHSTHSSRSIREHFETYIAPSNDTPVIIYVHGNDRDRATPFRVELCSNFKNMGYHVFAIDYRGYGDSTGKPTEEGVVKDVLSLYYLIMSHRPDIKIYLYGHSLGTGILDINTKILIMHAEDDSFVPHSHGESLYQIGKKAGKDVKFLSLNKELGLGHFLQSHKPIYDHIKKLFN